MTLLTLSYLVNVVITFTVSFGIWRNHGGMTDVYGRDTPARRILACVYLTIGMISLYALLQLSLGNTGIAQAIAMTLFPLQIIYKLITARGLWVAHPVVLANLGVAVLLSMTLLFGT